MADADSLNLFFNVNGIQEAIVGMNTLGKVTGAFGLEVSRLQANLGSSIGSLDKLNAKSGSLNISIDKQVQAYSRLSSILADAKRGYISLLQSSNDGGKSLSAIQTNIASLETKLGTLRQNLQAVGVNFDAAAAKARNFGNAAQFANVSFKASSSGGGGIDFSKPNKGYSDLSVAIGRVSHETSNFNKVTKETDNGVIAATARILKYQLAYLAIFGSIRGAKGAVEEFIKVNRQLADIAIVVDPLVVSLKQIEDSAISLSKQFGITVNDVLGSFNIFARLGLQQAEFTEATKAAFLGANTIGIDATRVTEALTAAIFTYGVEVKDLTTILSQFLRVSNEFPVAASDFIGALTSVGAAADEVGISLQELAAITTAINASTRKSGTAIGQSLKTQLARLVRPETEALLNQVGVAVRSSENDFRDMGKVLDDLAKVWDGLTEVQRVNIAVAIGGIRRYVDFLALMEQYPVKIAAMSSALNATNEVFRANDIVMQTVEKQLAVTGVQIDSFRIALGKDFAPTVLLVAKSFGALASGLAFISDTLVGGSIISVLTKTVVVFGALSVAAKVFGGSAKVAAISTRELGISQAAAIANGYKFAGSMTAAASGATVLTRAITTLKAAFNPLLLILSVGISLLTEALAAFVTTSTINADFSNFELPSGDALKIFTDQREAIDKQVESLDLLKSRFINLTDTIENNQIGSEKYTKAITVARQLTLDFTKTHPQLATAMDKTTKAYQEGKGSLDNFNQSIADSISKLRTQGEELDRLLVKLKTQKAFELGVTIENAEQTIADLSSITDLAQILSESSFSARNNRQGILSDILGKFDGDASLDDLTKLKDKFQVNLGEFISTTQDQVDLLQGAFDQLESRGVKVPAAQTESLSQLKNALSLAKKQKLELDREFERPLNQHTTLSKEISLTKEELADLTNSLLKTDRVFDAVSDNANGISTGFRNIVFAARQLSVEASTAREELNKMKLTPENFIPPSGEIKNFISNIEPPSLDLKFNVLAGETDSTVKFIESILIRAGKTSNEISGEISKNLQKDFTSLLTNIAQINNQKTKATSAISDLNNQLVLLQTNSKAIDSGQEFEVTLRGQKEIISGLDQREAKEKSISTEIRTQEANLRELDNLLSKISLNPTEIDKFSALIGKLESEQLSTDFFAKSINDVIKLKSELESITLKGIVDPRELEKLSLISRITGNEFNKSEVIVQSFVRNVESIFSRIQTNKSAQLVAQSFIDNYSKELVERGASLELPNITEREALSITAIINDLEVKRAEQERNLKLAKEEEGTLQGQLDKYFRMKDAVALLQNLLTDNNRSVQQAAEIAQSLTGIYRDQLSLLEETGATEKEIFANKELVARLNAKFTEQAASLLTGQNRENALIKTKTELSKDLLSIELERLRTHKDIKAAIEAQDISKGLNQDITGAFLDIPGERIENRERAAEITQQILDIEREISNERLKGNEANLQSISDNQQKLKELKKEQKDLTNVFKEFLDFFQKTGELISKAFQDAAAKKFIISLGLDPVTKAIGEGISGAVNNVLIPKQKEILGQYQIISDAFIKSYNESQGNYLSTSTDENTRHIDGLAAQFTRHIEGISRALKGEGTASDSVGSDTQRKEFSDLLSRSETISSILKSFPSTSTNPQFSPADPDERGLLGLPVKIEDPENKGKESAAETRNRKLMEVVRSSSIYLASQLGTILGSALGGSTRGANTGSGLGGTAGGILDQIFNRKTLESGLEVATSGLLSTLLPVGGSIIGGLLGGLFGGDDEPERKRELIVAQNTKAIEALTDSLNQLDASVLNAPSNFVVPRNPGGVGNQSGPTVNLYVSSNNADEVANTVVRVIEEQYGRAINTSGTTRRYAI